ncbi:hypothetical protein B0J12DRAFT_735174 [Macrophomina phaseolina]|uniref:Uncharacterized protein n=1 Tax=Macrophomina phaseolina TaxID=35725 RepID=A0ABQ8GSS1_9PEZI|nr:hypothetical protein B0J12DRAFT_735174 [Macrophomina phaseolina]
MSNLRNILNEDSSTPLSNDRCESSVNPSSFNGHPKIATVKSPNSGSLEKMSLDFVAPGNRSASNRASQSRCHSPGYAHYGYVAEHNHLSLPARNHRVRTHYSGACVTASAQHSSWTSINSTFNYRRPSSTGSTNYTDHNSLSTNYRSSLSHSSRNGCADASRREPRHAYGEEERAFIMVCAILRSMAWKEIEKEFRERFPAGQKRHHQEDGLWPTYPQQERTISGLTCAYYRIRNQWGIPKVRGVCDEQKPEVMAVVKKTILNMHNFPDLKKYAQ